jgi:hypothetical protein
MGKRTGSKGGAFELHVWQEMTECEAALMATSCSDNIYRAGFGLLFHGCLQRLQNLHVLVKHDDRSGLLTSSSIFASAISCSLPLPPETFCASAICDLTASSLKSSNLNPSTALMLRTEFGCTIANPPDTVIFVSNLTSPKDGVGPTEELFAATSLFNDLDKTRLQLFYRGDVLGEDTHLPGLGGHVHLYTVTSQFEVRWIEGAGHGDTYTSVDL